MSEKGGPDPRNPLWIPPAYTCGKNIIASSCICHASAVN